MSSVYTRTDSRLNCVAVDYEPTNYKEKRELIKRGWISGRLTILIESEFRRVACARFLKFFKDTRNG